MDKPRFPLDPPTNKQMEMLGKLFADEITSQEFRDFLDEDMPDSVSKDMIIDAFDALTRMEKTGADEDIIAADDAVRRLIEGDG